MYAQFSGQGISVSGELRSHGDTGVGDLLVEIYDVRTNTTIQRAQVTHGQFELDHVPAGSYGVRLVTTPGATPIVQEYYEVERGGAPLVLDLPEQQGARPISGLVSVRELQHPIPKKAVREAYQAQQLVRTHNLPKAIAKLEEAIRIDPDYRDAHCNLGVLYARAGRGAEARAQLQKAIDIGPPTAPIYVDLALISAALRQFSEAELFARKALELDPANSIAQQVLQNQPSH
jgi:tetratricopeptide (TPR) repeat protein